ncbi:MAG: acyltransferase domain-containing protein, partial [Gemmataceae bacterium]
LAAMELIAGKADVVVTGGADTFNDIFMFMCFSKTPALSASGNSRPFDANGDGTILGEGLGLVVLKRLADAEAAGDTIYAVIRGLGTSSDGKGNAIYAPSAAGQERCLRNAYASAGIAPSTIELVEAHGTGTKVGDATEATALTTVFGAEQEKPRPWCALGSVKSQIGHTKAAAGAASLIKVALSLHNKVLPPTIKVTQPVDPLGATNSPFYLNSRMRPWLPPVGHPRRATTSAFGFGGSNFHAVLEEYQSAKADPDWDDRTQIVALSGNSLVELTEQLATVPGGGEWPQFAEYAAGTRARFRINHPHRLAFAVTRDMDRAKLVASAQTLLARGSHGSAHTPDGVHYGTGAAGPLAVLFPGQGSQSVGMLRELTCTFPEMLETLAEANAAHARVQGTAGPRLSDVIYPPSSFVAEAAVGHENVLRATNLAQPAIGALSLGLWKLLNERFGLAADAFAGHSFGELTALAAAERLRPIDFHTLAEVRGTLMAQQRSGDPGTMLAVLASVETIEQLIQSAGLNLVIANQNSPMQSVLSGPTVEIDRAANLLLEAGLRITRLSVAAAFHSPLVAEAAKPFREALETVAFLPGRQPVYANTTASVYPVGTDEAKTLLAEQLAKPVLFADEIRALAGSGVRTFLEVGPGGVLARLAEATLGTEKGAEFLAIDSSSGRRASMLDLADVLARLVARGHALNLTAWEQSARPRPL